MFGLVRFDGLGLTGREAVNSFATAEIGWQSDTMAKAERDASPQAG